jgi:hypothetical protein
MPYLFDVHEGADPVVGLWQDARRRYRQMHAAYNCLSAVLRARPVDDRAASEAQARADALGTLYEQSCDRVYNTEASSLEGVLAKLQCARQCIRDIVPEGTDPEPTCDIELRFVFAVERDVRRLIAVARRRTKRARLRAKQKNREKPIVTALRGVGSRDVATSPGTSSAAVADPL